MSLLTYSSAGGYAPNRERQLIQVRDHTRDDVVVRAMFHTRDMGIPVVLIAGKSLHADVHGTFWKMNLNWTRKR